MKQGTIILLSAVAVVIIGGGAYVLGRSSANKNSATVLTNTPTVRENSNASDDITNTNTTVANSNRVVNVNAAVNTNAATTLSEQPDQQTYSAYFSDGFLAKMPVSQEFNPSLVTRTTTYTQTDKFCTSLMVIQDIAVGQLSTATYNTGTQQYVRPKAAFQHSITTGNSIGCEDLALNIGAYEYKIYVNNTLAIVLPFRVQ